MSRLRTFSGRELVKLLSAHGFRQVRQRGSHIVMQAESEGSTVTVVIPDHAEVRVGTLLSIIRQSRLSREHFDA